MNNETETVSGIKIEKIKNIKKYKISNQSQNIKKAPPMLTMKEMEAGSFQKRLSKKSFDVC